jgi:exo-beta-1,3-glucanase (GH17 family)
MPAHDSEPAAKRPGAARRGAVLLLLAIALALILAQAVSQGRPAALPEAAGAPRTQMLPCVSYAPFRRAGETPFDAGLHIAPQAIEADLRLLRAVTGCVRTYGLDHGLDAVPAVARRLGLRVVLGAWIGRDAAANEAQLRRALDLAHEYRDVVQLLVVGNEVLLRRELAPEALAALLARARRESPVPVAYADVWEFWLRHGPALREHVDIVAAHILPYWEDEPVGVDQAVDHVYAIAARLQRNFGSTPVFIAETGWPAAGRQRGPAVPGRDEQARFVRGNAGAAGGRAAGLQPDRGLRPALEARARRRDGRRLGPVRCRRDTARAARRPAAARPALVLAAAHRSVLVRRPV